MSRKVGFGDTYFDPDLNGGDIDFDFFGGEATPDSAADGAGAAAKVNPLGPSSKGVQVQRNNNALYNISYTINNGNHGGEQTSLGTPAGAASERQQVPAFEIRNRSRAGVPKMEGGEEQTIDDDDDEGDKKTGENNQLDNEMFTANTHRAMYTNHSENAEGAGDEGKKPGVETSQQSSADGAADDDEPVFSECDDSASDLFSDDDSLDESEEEYLDSDITEVSPLSSANMSPLPESPRRTPDPRLKRQLLKNHSLSASPKLGVRRTKGEANGRSSAPPSNGSERTCGTNNARGGSGTSSCSGSECGHDTVDLNELARAIRELEEDQRKRKGGSERSYKTASAGCVRARKNMTFTNDEVRKIDHENKRLLRKIIEKSRRPLPHAVAVHHAGRVASSAINRVKDMRKIETENQVILKRLLAAKPTKELSREFLLGSAPKSAATSPSIPESKSSYSLASAPAPARGRAGRCHSTGSLSGNSWTGSGISTPTAAKGRPARPTRGIVAAAATNGTIANER